MGHAPDVSENLLLLLLLQHYNFDGRFSGLQAGTAANLGCTVRTRYVMIQAAEAVSQQLTAMPSSAFYL
jgi:hypothetical protein